MADAVVCNFSGTPDSIRVSADLVFGTVKTCPTTKMPIDLSAEANLPEEPEVEPTREKGRKMSTYGRASADCPAFRFNVNQQFFGRQPWL